MTTEAVNEVGRGHVWTGEQGIGIKLVDELGGVIDAIAYAKKMANFKPGEKASLVMLPTMKQSLLSKVLGGGPFGAAGASNSKSSAKLEALEPYIRLLGLLPGTMGQQLMDAIPGSVWLEPQTPQARLPFAIQWND